MKNRILVGIFIVGCLGLLIIEPALAGPGGKIARAAFETFWGRVALVILTIIFLPLIILISIQEKIAERRARKDLRFMAGYSPLFEFLNIRNRAKDCFLRVHSGWENEDLSQVTDWMTDWYWQNQQMGYLDRWKSEGLINICDVKRITGITPLMVIHRNNGAEHEGSMVSISIEAEMKDCLQERNSGKIVEGSERYKEVRTIWSFTIENGAWKVSDIEEGGMALEYVKMGKELPKIETTIVSGQAVLFGNEKIQ